MSITAILTLFKRPETLIEQLTSIQNQSITPEQIIIWQNCVEGIKMPEIPEYLNKNVTTIISSKNFGVWARFSVGMLVNTKYICVFDDDTIPGSDWFNNCVETMKTHRGLLGTIGLRFVPGNEYKCLRRIGWADYNNHNTERVDIVGHAWFFEKEWLSYFLEYHPNYDEMLCSGEDILFSYVLQKHGINTYVPPHPINNMKLWGSMPETAWKYGVSPVAITADLNSGIKFDNALKLFINCGFKTMNNSRLIGNSVDHLDQIFQKIHNNEYFGVIRPSDGEWLILENKTFTNIDNWTNTADGILRLHLLESVKTIKHNLYIGICCNGCSCCDYKVHNDYLNKYHVQSGQLTYANLFCNLNWKKTVDFLQSYHNGFYLITCGNKECNLPIKERFLIDKYLVNNWNNVWESETKRIIEYVKNKQNVLVCFAAGPLSKIWIPKCMDISPNNFYMDIGSVLDTYTREDNNPRSYTYTNQTNMCNHR